MKPQVLLIVSDPALGEGYRLLLEEQGCTVTALFGSTKQLHLPKDLDVDVVVVGGEVPGDDYARLSNSVHKHIPKAKVIALDATSDHKLASADGHANGNTPVEWLKLVMNAAGSRRRTGP